MSVVVLGDRLWYPAEVGSGGRRDHSANDRAGAGIASKLPERDQESYSAMQDYRHETSMPPANCRGVVEPESLQLLRRMTVMLRAGRGGTTWVRACSRRHLGPGSRPAATMMVPKLYRWSRGENLLGRFPFHWRRNETDATQDPMCTFAGEGVVRQRYQPGAVDAGHDQLAMWLLDRARTA